MALANQIKRKSPEPTKPEKVQTLSGVVQNQTIRPQDNVVLENPGKTTLTLRLPSDLKLALMERAAQEDRTLSNLVIRLLREGVGL